VRYFRILLLIWILACAGCGGRTPEPPEGAESAQLEVERSLATVDPEASLALFAYDRDAPIDIQTVAERSVDGIAQVDFTYASPKGGRVPARLVLPGGAGPFPAIVYMHGSSGDIDLMTPEAMNFARLGAMGILIDSPHIRPGGYVPDGSAGSTWPYYTEQDRRDQIQLIIDLQRAVDILLARPEVDPERIAYLGISYGGAMGGLLAGVETRIKAYVLIVGDGGLVEHTSILDENGWPDHFSQPWVEAMWPIEPLHFVGRAAPAALLYQNGLIDQSVSRSNALRYQAAGSEPKTVLWYEGGHEISGWTTAWMDRAAWLQDYLGQPLTWFEPNYHPGMVGVDRACTGWAILSLATAAYFLWAPGRVGGRGVLERILWCVAALTLGPLSILIFRLSFGFWPHSRASDTAEGAWRAAAIGATYLGSAMAISLFFGITLDNLLKVESLWLQLAIVYLLPLGIFWVLLGGLRKRLAVRPAARLLLMNVLWAAALPVGSWLSQVMLIPSDLDPRVWWVMAAGSMTGWLVAFPLTYLLQRRRWIVWPTAGQPEVEWAGRAGPALAAALSFLLALLSIAAVIWISSGLSLPELINAL
jgi:poly(3-hydroxybutyrate) depolymerase